MASYGGRLCGSSIRYLPGIGRIRRKSWTYRSGLSQSRDMKALVLNALGRGFDLDEVDIASPTGREVLVDVQASGLCHTDLLFATHDIAPTPSVLGHEVAGIVAAVGPDVTHARVGHHVVGSLAQSCGACGRCLSGRS